VITKLMCAMRTVMERPIVVGLVLLLVLLASAPASAQTTRTGAPKTAALAKELGKLGTAVSTSRALSRAQRRTLARHPRAAAKAVRARKACAAATSLLRLHAGIDRSARRAKGARKRSLRKLQARGARDRQLVLRLVAKGKACGGTAAFSVDTTLKPAAKELPALNGVKRPLARLADPYGGGADFVADELILSTNDKAVVDAFVARWRGKLLQTVDVPGDGPDQHLVRITTSRANLANLGALAQKLSKTRGADLRASSEAGLGAIAAAAAEANRGLKVGLDFVGLGSAHAGGFTVEAASGPDGWNTTAPPAWTPNAHRWEHLADDGPIGTGVAGAWQLLGQFGRLQAGSIRLAVLDQGFAPSTNGDFPADIIAISNVPFLDALGTPNTAGCSGGSSCPWHGTGVVNAAMGVTDNGIGAAGPAGPVARPVIVFTLYDFFTGIAAVIEAAAAGARVINMSYGADVPAIVSWAVAPFEIATGAARAGGVLLFAAAGNSSTDVDATDCFIVCWEETLHTPCENLGVICVGALQKGGTAPACYSNWGREAVRLWAPGSVLVGADPGPGGSGVHQVNGTSVASPWAAGVAALGWSAVPSAGANQVEAALRARFKVGGAASTRCDGGGVDRHLADRIVDANAFVRDLLPPLFQITAPAEGTTVRRGAPLAFNSQTYDDGLGAPTITWTREGDPAPLGTGPSINRNDLPYGANTITATAAFPGGMTLTDTRHVTITNDPPRVEIVTPEDGDTFFQASTINLRGVSFDINEPGSDLEDSQVSWFLDGAGTAFATGHDATTTGLSPGTHTIHFRGSDGRETATDSVTITVNANPPNLPPTVDITSPPNNTQYLVEFTPDATGYYKDVAFTTTASDPESGALSYAWTVSVNGGTYNPIAPRSGTLQNPTFRLRQDTTDLCNIDTFDVRVTVTDPAMNPAFDTVRVKLEPGPC